MEPSPRPEAGAGPGDSVWPPPISRQAPPARRLTDAERRNFQSRWSYTRGAFFAALIGAQQYPFHRGYHSLRAGLQYMVGHDRFGALLLVSCAGLALYSAWVAVRGWGVFLRLRREREQSI